MIRRQKIIDTLRQKLNDTDISHIAIIGENGIGKSTFLRDLEGDGFFGEPGTYTYIYLEKGAEIDEELLKNSNNTILDTEDSHDASFWNDTIARLPEDHKLIFTSNVPLEIDGVENIILGIISFREYADSQGYPIEIAKVLSGECDIEQLNALKDVYMERGGYPHHLTHPESIGEDFDKLRSIIESQVFDKEHEALIEFTRTLALNLGNPFKADQIAKLLGISRRKVNKYTEILIGQGIIQAVGPWGPNTTTETSRHVKIYFTDLSVIKVLLGDTFNQGTLKVGALENFIFLELERKLDETHSISYYRKKSGAEITFILENNDTGTITPVEVTLRESEVISQVFRTFDADYHDRVDRYMLVNATYGGKKDMNGTPIIILPHVAI